LAEYQSNLNCREGVAAKHERNTCLFFIDLTLIEAAARSGQDRLAQALRVERARVKGEPLKKEWAA